MTIACLMYVCNESAVQCQIFICKLLTCVVFMENAVLSVQLFLRTSQMASMSVCSLAFLIVVK